MGGKLQDRVGQDVADHGICNVLSVHPVGSAFHRLKNPVDFRFAFRIGLFGCRPEALQLFRLVGNLHTVLISGLLICRFFALCPFSILDSQQDLCEVWSPTR